MPIVAHTRPYVIGVDSHARTHTYTILAADGALIATGRFPATAAGIDRAIAWAGRRTADDPAVLWAVEGIGSYGANLARALAGHGRLAVEAPRTAARHRHHAGKSDPLDAERIARNTLAQPVDRLLLPRAQDGEREALQVLLAARADMTGERTRKINALTARARLTDLGIDARKALTKTQITRITAWRTRPADPPGARAARAEAVRLARRIRALDAEITQNMRDISALVRQTPARALLAEPGIGPVTAAVCYTAWSHPGRIRSEAAYAALAGVNPIPASSGNTIRHRLNRGGDRRLNAALHMAIITRARLDPETRAYIEKRGTEGRTPKEIRRCLKRYLARRIYRILTHTTRTEEQPPTPA